MSNKTMGEQIEELIEKHSKKIATEFIKELKVSLDTTVDNFFKKKEEQKKMNQDEDLVKALREAKAL